MVRNIFIAAVSAIALCAGSAQAQEQVTFGTDWLAQAEHGGFYQAVADCTYAKYGLNVKIVQGGPNAANSALLIAGRIDFYMGNQQEQLTAVEKGIPLIDVAAIFQKNPQVFLAHPDQGVNTFNDMAKLQTIFMGKDGYLSFFEWMKGLKVGFKDEQYKPYTFNPAPFIANKQSAQQGYLTSEPYAVEQVAKFKPKVFLLADAGYSPYAELITTRREIVEKKPELVQKFVDATMEGWYNYLYGDNKKANDLIKKDNPEMTDGQIAYSIEKLKEYGIVESGEALEKGIGCMTPARYEAFAQLLKDIKIIQASTDPKKAYTTQFVCKGVGMALKKK